MKIIKSLKKFIREDVAASAVEYALILSLVGLAVAVGAGKLGTSVNSGLEAVGQTVGTKLGTPTAASAPGG